MTIPYDIARLLSYVWCPSLLAAHVVIGIPGGMIGLAFLYVSALIVLNVVAGRFARQFRRSSGALPVEAASLEKYYHVEILYAVLVVSAVVGVCGVFGLMQRHGFDVDAFFSFSRFQRMSKSLYHSLDEDSVGGVYLSAMYLCPLLGGFLMRSRFKRVWFLFFAFFPPLCLMLVANLKAMLTFSLSLFVAAYISSSMVCNRGFRVRPRSILKVGLLIVCAAMLVGFSAILRYSDDEGRENLQDGGPARVAVNYGIAHSACFDAFLSEEDFFRKEVSLGRRTLLGPFSFLGVESRVRGVYIDWSYFSNRGGTIEYNSNIYTAFRPLVEDFSVCGSLLVAAFASFFASCAGVRLLDSKRHGWLEVRIVVYTAFLQYAMDSFLGSSWSYNSVIMAELLLGGVLLLASRR